MKSFKRCPFLLTMLFIITSLACSGSGGKSDPSAPPNPSIATLVVDELSVPAGEERRLTVDTLVVKKNIQIDGRLIFEYREGAAEAATIQFEGTEARLSGQIIVEPAREKEETQGVAQRIWSFLFPAVFAQRNPGGFGLVGRDFVIESLTATRWQFFPTLSVEAADGQDANELRYNSPQFSSILSGTGRDGGDIIIRSPNATLEIFFDPTTQEGPRLKLGNGGNGGNVLIIDSSLPNQVNQSPFEITADDGGKSGELKIETKDLWLINADDPIIPLRGGRGGHGGNIRWDVSDGHEFVGLKEIILTAGKGGEGRVAGGHGGHVRYNSNRVINGKGEPTTSVKARGGDGGDIMDFELKTPLVTHNGAPIIVQDSQTKSVAAGNGGYALVRGNKGRDGQSAADLPLAMPGRDGKDPGTIDVKHGNGASVRGASHHYPITASGGNGGMPSRPEAENELRNVFPFLGVGLTDVLISTGEGGKGGDGCNGGSSSLREGGRGGNAGVWTILSGDGGSSARGGSGGSIYYDQVNIGKAGDGGNGSPPGAPGGLAPFADGVGSGGAGTQGKAPDGQRFGTPPVLLPGNAGSECPSVSASPAGRPRLVDACPLGLNTAPDGSIQVNDIDVTAEYHETLITTPGETREWVTRIRPCNRTADPNCVHQFITTTPDGQTVSGQTVSGNNLQFLMSEGRPFCTPAGRVWYVHEPYETTRTFTGQDPTNRQPNVFISFNQTRRTQCLNCGGGLQCVQRRFPNARCVLVNRDIPEGQPGRYTLCYDGSFAQECNRP